MPLHCTSCGRDTGIEPDIAGRPDWVMIELARNWLCSTCLSYAEEEHRQDARRALENQAMEEHFRRHPHG